MNNQQTNYGWVSQRPPHTSKYIPKKLFELIPDGVQTIFDAGCGNGYLAGYLSELGYAVTGVDISEDGILIAQQAYPKVEFFTRSLYENLFDIKENVDLVVSSEVIEHLFYPSRYLANLYSIIRPGGWIILTTPYHGWLKNTLLSLFDKWDSHHTVHWEGGHIKFYSEKTLSEALERAGFSNVKFNNAGRLPFLWKSMVCRAQKG